MELLVGNPGTEETVRSPITKQRCLGVLSLVSLTVVIAKSALPTEEQFLRHSSRCGPFIKGCIFVIVGKQVS